MSRRVVVPESDGVQVIENERVVSGLFHRVLVITIESQPKELTKRSVLTPESSALQVEPKR